MFSEFRRPMERPARAFIFDLDGTLADTMPAHFVAWTAVARKYGLSFPEARFYAMGGVPTTKIAALLIQEAGLSLDPQVISLEKEQAYFDSLAPEGIHAIAPVLELARRHRAEGPLAIGSGGVRRVVMRSLEALGITDWFGAIVAAEDTAHHKPEPGRVPRGRAPPERRSRHLHRLRGHGHRPRSRPPRRHARRRRQTPHRGR